MKRTSIVFAFLISLALASSANAAIWTFDGGINTDQSAATHALVDLTGFGGGILSATLDDVTGDFEWSVAFFGTSGPAVAAHFHGPAFSGATGGVTLGTPSLVGSTGGIFSGVSVLGAPEIADLTGGGLFGAGDETPWYHNIHTASNPAGEMRGQLFVTSVVPLPPAIWLLLSSVVAAVGIGRRKA